MKSGYNKVMKTDVSVTDVVTSYDKPLLLLFLRSDGIELSLQ